MIKDSPIRLSDKIFRFNFKIISTRTLRKFIPNGSARHAITKEYFIESGNQKLFPLQRILLWTSHCEQDCPRVKKAKGRPSYQAKKTTGVFSEILAELLLIRDISFVDIHVEIADEIEVNMLQQRLLTSTRCLFYHY